MLVLAGCQAGFASTIGGAAGPAVIRPTVTVTKVVKVRAVDPHTYRTATAVAPVPDPKRKASSWWGISVNVNHHSSLTTDSPVDDSTSRYVQPTTAVQEKNAVNLDNSSTGKVWAGSGLSGKANGQIIGIDGTEAYTCSGTVVHSAAQDLVVTAGHCVWNIPVGKSHSSGGSPMARLDQIWFIPGASDLSDPLQLDADGNPELDAPYGVWKVGAAHTNTRWLENTWVSQTGSGIDRTERMHGEGSYDDVAFVTIEPLNGRQIEQVTGAQGLLFANSAPSSPDLVHPTVVVGYPSASPFDGTVQRFCSSAEIQTYQGDSYSRTAALPCQMTPGSSGGAWFAGFDQVDGSGYVYGVTSRGGDGELTVALLSLGLDYPLYATVGAG